MSRGSGRLVYSTDEATRQRAAAAQAAAAKPPWLAGPPLPPEKQTVSIRREVKGRGGKTATLVYDLRLSEADFKDLARRLREACGSGAGCPVVGVEYGIEAYFVPEGEGRAIETTEKSRLEIVAAVARSGDAAIKRLLLDGKMLYTEPLY